MSTKSSLALTEITEKYNIHIYKELVDESYYIEDDKGRVKLTKAIAKEFAKILIKIKEEDKNDKQR